MKRALITGVGAVALAAFGATAALGPGETAKTKPQAPAASPTKADIVDTAVGAGKFKTLVAAVKAADLVAALRSPGPFTVFAPTDEAFAKLPAGTVESLLKPENKDKLVAILKYHVVQGAVPASEAVKLDGKAVKTLNGAEFNVVVKDGKVTIGNDPKKMATVTATDVMATNGVIHVIDTVILPPEPTPAPAAAR